MAINTLNLWSNSCEALVWKAVSIRIKDLKSNSHNSDSTSHDLDFASHNSEKKLLVITRIS